MGGALRFVAGLAAMLACAAGLMACGGGDESSSSTADASTPSSAAEAKAPSAGPPDGGGGMGGGAGGEEATQPERTPAQEREHQARERASYERARYGNPSRRSAPFAEYSGRSTAKGQPRLHLAEFGQEAVAGERGEVQAAIDGYLSASAAGEWDRACRYVAAAVEARAEELARQSGEGEGCGTALEAVVKAFGGVKVRAPEGIASLRVQVGGRNGEGAGFALFHGSDGGDYWIAVRKAAGDWTVLSVAPQRFG